MNRKRNTNEFYFLSWVAFVLAVVFFVIAVWNADWILVEKGYYLLTFFLGIFSSFVLSKVIRDNQEDKADGLGDYMPPKAKE